MPTVVYKDTVEGAQLQTMTPGQQGRYKVRGALVDYTDLPSGSSDPWVLEKCIDALGAGWQLNDGISGPGGVGSLNVTLRRHIAKARTANLISIQAYYEPGTFDGAVGSWMIRDDSTLVSVQTNLEPGTRRPVKCSWVDPNDKSNKIPADYVMYKYMAPFRTVLISGTMLGRPPYIQRQAMRHVNNGTWLGYPKGYWLVDRYSTDTRDSNSTTQVVCSVSTWEEHDWSEYGVLRSHLTGKYAQVRDKDVDDLVKRPYAPGQMRTNGMVRICPYQFVNLVNLFGDFPLDTI